MHVDTTQTTSHVGLCAGYGGIELGLKRVIPDLRSVALCEIEAFACANLVSKMEAGLMDPAPIWTDLKTFPWRAFRDRVDILTGGYPCQPFSAAGLRRGKDDPRHLWPWIADGIRAMRPRLCFFENVEGHISMGLSDVIEDLVGMGYRVAWGIFSAAEVGAPHQRKRMFILANCNSQRLEGWISGSVQECSGQLASRAICAWPSRPGQQQYEWEPPRVVGGQLDNPAGTGSWCKGGDVVHKGRQTSDSRAKSISQDSQRQTSAAIPDDKSTGSDGGEAMGNANCSRDTQPSVEQSNLPAKSSGCDTEAMGDTNCQGSQERTGPGGAGIQGTDADGGTDADREAESSLGGNPDGASGGMDYAKLHVTCDNRTDELRLLGNGVVPATAEKAFRVLLGKLR